MNVFEIINTEYNLFIRSGEECSSNFCVTAMDIPKIIIWLVYFCSSVLLNPKIMKNCQKIFVFSREIDICERQNGGKMSHENQDAFQFLKEATFRRILAFCNAPKWGHFGLISRCSFALVSCWDPLGNTCRRFCLKPLILPLPWQLESPYVCIDMKQARCSAPHIDTPVQNYSILLRESHEPYRSSDPPDRPCLQSDS